MIKAVVVHFLNVELQTQRQEVNCEFKGMSYRDNINPPIIYTTMFKKQQN